MLQSSLVVKKTQFNYKADLLRMSEIINLMALSTH